MARSYALGPLNPRFNLSKCLEAILRNHLPDDAHERATGRLFISVTRIADNCNEILSEFRTREDLIKAILCGCFIPTYSGYMPIRYRGYRYIDGSVTNNQPTVDSDTITVSPFSGESDICPQNTHSQSLHMNVSNMVIDLSEENISRFWHVLIPQQPAALISMCQQGFDDTLRYLHRSRALVQAKSFFVTSVFLIATDDEDVAGRRPQLGAQQCHPLGRDRAVRDGRLRSAANGEATMLMTTTSAITSEKVIKPLNAEVRSNIRATTIAPVDAIVATLKT